MVSPDATLKATLPDNENSQNFYHKVYYNVFNSATYETILKYVYTNGIPVSNGGAYDFLESESGP